MTVFSFSIFNKNVRDALKDNSEHPLFSDRWASPCEFEIEADNADQASEKVDIKYPPSEGFVSQLKPG